MKIAIIGGGPAGCAAAHYAKENVPGAHITLFEAAPVLGGRTTSLRKDGWVVDTGAGFVTNFYPRLFSIASKQGFSDIIVEMNRISGLAKEGKVAPLNIGSTVSFLKFPFLRTWEKMKMASWTGAMTLKRKSYDLADPRTLVSIDDMSIEEYALQKLNPNIYHSLIRPGIEPFWYFSCADVSRALVMGLTSKAAGARFYSLPKGIDQICTHLASGAERKLGAAVQKITKEEHSYSLHYRQQEAEYHASFDRVVVATTASVANTITQELSISPVVRVFLETQSYAANIHICFRIALQPQELIAGSIFPCDSQRRMLAAIAFHRAKHSAHERDEELVSIYLSDAGAKEVMAFSDSELGTYAWEKARGCYPQLPEKAEIFSIHRRKEAIPVHAVGRYRKAVEAQEEQEESDIQFCGDYWATATIEGAVATAQRSILRWTSR